MKVRCLVPFNAYGYIKSAGEEFDIDIEHDGIRLDLEKLGWIVPLENKVSVDHEPKEPKKNTKKAK